MSGLPDDETALQAESRKMMERYMEESKKRADMLEQEKRMREEEERKAAELMKRQLQERQEKERAR